MLGKSLRYLAQNPARLIKALAADPREAWIKFYDRYDERRERRAPLFRYEPDPGWERQLHETLGVHWPCDVTSEFNVLWTNVIGAMEENGIRVGPMGFGTWNDGDAALARAIWCLVTHLKPRTVVETGVGHGITSRFVLEALERNGAGHLWSVDLPPLDPALRRQVGVAVNKRERWSYIEGSSRRRLPALLSKVGRVDLFIHDSLHSAQNVRFEIDRAWAQLAPGGAIVVDDIDANWGFQSFGKAFAGYQSMICEAEPLHPDLRRFNKKGLFGIILKLPAQEATKEAKKAS